MSPGNSFYRLFRVFSKIKSPRLKIMALLAAHLSGRRYIGVYLDPVLACNIRCRMCYFSDEAARPRPGSPLTQAKLHQIEKAFFGRALKLQIGCGAEPTVYSGLKEMVERGKRAGIPYIELTTNGQLLTYDKLNALAAAGLSGITLSLHGTTAETYEYLMQGARFANLQRLIVDVARLQKEMPSFSLRVNYTMNNLNFRELANILALFGKARIDVLQVRPIQKLGETQYSDFSLEGIINEYDAVIQPLRQECKDKGVACILPTFDNLQAVDDKRSELSRVVEEITYCYVSNQSAYKPDFNLGEDTFDSYWRRHSLAMRLLGKILKGVKESASKIDHTKKMNYTMD